MIKKLLSFLAMGALVALSACATAVPGKSPAQTVYAVQADFNGLLNVAVAYTDLPRCEAPAAPQICSKTAAVAEIRKAAHAADAAIAAAQKAVGVAGSDASTVTLALSAATEAVGALRKILSIYGVR